MHSGIKRMYFQYYYYRQQNLSHWLKISGCNRVEVHNVQSCTIWSLTQWQYRFKVLLQYSVQYSINRIPYFSIYMHV